MSEYKKVAVVTGGGDGLGKGIALKYLQNGLKVVISDINKSVLEATKDEFAKKGFEVTTFVGDVSKKADQKALVDLAVKTYGHLDVFVNNAGIEGVKWLADETDESIDRLFGINVKGVIFGIQAACEQYKKQYEEDKKAGTKRIYKVINACSPHHHCTIASLLPA